MLSLPICTHFPSRGDTRDTQLDYRVFTLVHIYIKESVNFCWE